MPPVQDQGRIGACSVNAVANALDYELGRATGRAHSVSRLFIYYAARKYVLRVADISMDTGCSLRDACKSLERYGTCPEKVWPYKRRKMAVKPSRQAFQQALVLAGVQYRSMVQTLPRLLQCLANGHPVLLGMSVFSNIKTARLTGILGMPGPGDLPIGGHAVLLCGYNMVSKTFNVQNCWGERWGRKGFFTIPFEYVLNPDLCWDLWVLVLPSNLDAPMRLTEK